MSENQLQYQLTILYPPEFEGTHSLSETPLVIGRSQDADISLEDEWISRQHCQIWVESDTIWAQDLNSTNGTFLDGQLIHKQNIHVNSKIQLGKVVLKVDCLDPSPKEIPFPVAKQNPEISEDAPEEVPLELSHQSLHEEPSTNTEVFSDSSFTENREVPQEELNPLIGAEITERTTQWIQQLDGEALEFSCFIISTRELQQYREEGKEEASQFLSIEIYEILQGEKISDELLFQIQPGIFAFILHGMNREQCLFFGNELHQLIKKQIFNYLGEVLEISPLIGGSLIQSTTGSVCATELFNRALEANEKAQGEESGFFFQGN